MFRVYNLRAFLTLRRSAARVQSFSRTNVNLQGLHIAQSNDSIPETPPPEFKRNLHGRLRGLITKFLLLCIGYQIVDSYYEDVKAEEVFQSLRSIRYFSAHPELLAMHWFGPVELHTLSENSLYIIQRHPLVREMLRGSGYTLQTAAQSNQQQNGTGTAAATAPSDVSDIVRTTDFTVIAQKNRVRSVRIGLSSYLPLLAIRPFDSQLKFCVQYGVRLNQKPTPPPSSSSSSSSWSLSSSSTPPPPETSAAATAAADQYTVVVFAEYRRGRIYPLDIYVTQQHDFQSEKTLALPVVTHAYMSGDGAQEPGSYFFELETMQTNGDNIATGSGIRFERVLRNFKQTDWVVIQQQVIRTATLSSQSQDSADSNDQSQNKDQ